MAEAASLAPPDGGAAHGIWTMWMQGMLRPAPRGDKASLPSLMPVAARTVTMQAAEPVAAR